MGLTGFSEVLGSQLHKTGNYSVSLKLSRAKEENRISVTEYLILDSSLNRSGIWAIAAAPPPPRHVLQFPFLVFLNYSSEIFEEQLVVNELGKSAITQVMKYKYICLTILQGNLGNQDSPWIALATSEGKKTGVIKNLSANNLTGGFQRCASCPLPNRSQVARLIYGKY